VLAELLLCLTFFGKTELVWWPMPMLDTTSKLILMPMLTLMQVVDVVEL